ncbi:MAG: response regulator transcription factor [Lachnospiraceae bacterium]|nr:response regulator transcription factor [Lachnospiraceae bacterium]
MNHIYECKILLVDDNRELLSMVTRMLKREGFSQIKAVSCCREAKEALQEELPELIILDVMLPDGNGFSLFQEIRQKADIPILFLSARDEDNDRLLGLGLGADDYLTKPFLPKELSLRIGAIIRRTYLSGHEAQSRASDLTLGERTVHFDQGSVKGPLGETALTAKELLILKKLYENLNKIVTFDALCDAVWGDGYYTYENTLMVHIRRLREKLEEDPSHPKWLLTARGIGYRLSVPLS